MPNYEESKRSFPIITVSHQVTSIQVNPSTATHVYLLSFDS